MHGWKTKNSARANLGDNLSEIERSYWKYLATWEKSEWEEVKESNGLSGEDEDCINSLVSGKVYTPLEDTRPYYYATYNEVRGSDYIFKPLSEGPASYVLTDKGDEY